MSEEFRELFVLKDKKSNKYLNDIWLSQDPKDITFYHSLEDAKKQMNRIKHGRFVSKGGTGFFAKDLVIVRLDVNPIEEILS